MSGERGLTRPPLGQDVRRYEPTLKERLAEGEIIKHWDGKFQVASMRKQGPSIVMTGFTGSHQIDFAASDTLRIQTHWRIFCETSDQHRRNSRARRHR